MAGTLTKQRFRYKAFDPARSQIIRGEMAMADAYGVRAALRVPVKMC